MQTFGLEFHLPSTARSAGCFVRVCFFSIRVGLLPHIKKSPSTPLAVDVKYREKRPIKSAERKSFARNF